MKSNNYSNKTNYSNNLDLNYLIENALEFYTQGNSNGNRIKKKSIEKVSEGLENIINKKFNQENYINSKKVIVNYTYNLIKDYYELKKQELQKELELKYNSFKGLNEKELEDLESKFEEAENTYLITKRKEKDIYNILNKRTYLRFKLKGKESKNGKISSLIDSKYIICYEGIEKNGKKQHYDITTPYYLNVKDKKGIDFLTKYIALQDTYSKYQKSEAHLGKNLSTKHHKQGFYEIAKKYEPIYQRLTSLGYIL